MWLLLTVAYFTLAVLVHAALCRTRWQASAVIKYLVAGGLCGLILAGQLMLLYGLDAPSLAGVLGFALVSELYVFLFTLVHSSVSSVLLRRLRRGGMTADDLDRVGNPAWMVESRLEKLVANDFLVADSGSYALTARAERTLFLFGHLHRFFRHDRRTRVEATGQADPKDRESAR